MLKVQLPHIHSMLREVPEDDLPKGEEELNFWRAVAWELSQLMQYGSHAVEPSIALSEFRRAGEQYIWEFWVNDLAMLRRDAYNWHGQNTSQWCYAGAIVLQKGRVSTNH